VETSAKPNTGSLELQVNVHNFAFDSNQALLDVDSIAGLEPPFSYVGGLQSGVGAMPAVLSLDFDTGGLAPGLYIADVAVSVSDEDVPGETSSELNAHLEVEISSPSVPTASAWGVFWAILLLLIVGSASLHVRIRRGESGS
jgi:hypothetical protein